MMDANRVRTKRHRRKTEKQRSGGDRGGWASRTEYIMVVAGTVVGLDTVWSFSYLCFKNGGGEARLLSFKTI